ncbi:MAG: DinB family protein [Bryobacterales bacterium]|nr:DinB family protein [Bryobacterales bacterium]
MVRVEGVLDSWKQIRRDTAQALRDMPAEALDFQPTAELMPFRQLAVHILNASRGMTGMLAAGETDFAAPGFRERMRAHYLDLDSLDQATLAVRLETALEEDRAALTAQSAGFWATLMTRFDGTPVTRLEMLQYAKEHELTHRSQMFMYLRLKGVIPPTTRRRMAAK